jgi:uncharacterized membrane protein
MAKYNSQFSILPTILLAIFILTYAAYFSWYTINRHNTLNSYTADLSLIDQPMWNTVRGPGGFMELTWGSRQQPRLAEHVEPILIPLALLFFVWDDVRVLLMAQSAALALGALPVFWIAQNQLSIFNDQLSKNKHSSFIVHYSPLIFAAVYLLSPHLQAANIADFHADPLAVTPLLFAFWYATQRRWGWMWLWALAVMLTKETLPTLPAMLGLWLAITTWVERRRPAPGFWHGLGLVAAGATWFLIATFLIVAPLARQHFGADGPIYFASRYTGGLAGLLPLLQDPARWRYMLGLLAAVGFLPLLAPELLLLGLPVLAANLLSNFPGQYSGEQHYSAPLAAAFTIAAIFGVKRLLSRLPRREITGVSLPLSQLAAVLLWLAGWALAYHALHGWTPLSLRAETYRPTPASEIAAELVARIPPDVPVSASAGLHPHLAHRRQIYVFPTVENADYLLVDVMDIPGVHPNDARAKLLDMLNSGWQLLAADHGLILARRFPPAGPATLPDAFFDFARASAAPAYPVNLSFGDGRLTLTGYDVLDDPDDGLIFRFYWQAAGELPEDLRLWPLVYDDRGQLLSDPSLVPMVAAVWYPPAAWPAGQVIITQTLPQRLPDIFHLGLAVGPEASYADPLRRWPLAGNQPGMRLYPGRWAQLASFKRQGPFLTHLPAMPTVDPLHPVDIRFGPAIHLTGFWLPAAPRGNALPLVLQWAAAAPPEADYTVFVHLLTADGARVTQADATPTWLTPALTSQWPLHTPMPDSHTLILPANLPPGPYTVQVGLYNPQTMERLTRPNGADFYELETIVKQVTHSPRPPWQR